MDKEIKNKTEKEEKNETGGEKSSFAKSTEDKVKELERQKNEYLEGWKKERADFLNYKKEEMERIVALMKYANEELILKILPILDNFELAFKNIPENLKNNENPEGKPSVSYGASIKGFLQIHQQLKDFLKSQGIEEIKAAGEKFDPNFHEVVGEVARGLSSGGSDESVRKEGEKREESGVIVEETQKGYTMNGKVIRPAKVKISK